MDYQLPKTLPATGAGFFAVGSLTNQLILMAVIFVSVWGGALLVRRYFRRGQSLNDK